MSRTSVSRTFFLLYNSDSDSKIELFETEESQYFLAYFSQIVSHLGGDSKFRLTEFIWLKNFISNCFPVAEKFGSFFHFCDFFSNGKFY